MKNFKELPPKDLQKIIDFWQVGHLHYKDLKNIQTIIKEELNINVSLKFAQDFWFDESRKYDSRFINVKDFSDYNKKRVVKACLNYIDWLCSSLSDSNIKEIIRDMK